MVRTVSLAMSLRAHVGDSKQAALLQGKQSITQVQQVSKIVQCKLKWAKGQASPPPKLWVAVLQIHQAASGQEKRSQSSGTSWRWCWGGKRSLMSTQELAARLHRTQNALAPQTPATGNGSCQQQKWRPTALQTARVHPRAAVDSVAAVIRRQLCQGAQPLPPALTVW